MFQRLPAAVCILIACLAFARAQPNLIKNPDFETRFPGSSLPAEGWWLYEARGQADARVDRAIAHSGVASVRLHAKEKDARFAVISPPFAVSPGDDLIFSGRVRSDRAVPPGTRSNFSLAFRDAEGRVFDRAVVPVEPPPGVWTELVGKATVPAGAVRAELHLGYTSAPATLWYDDVSAVITNSISLALMRPPQPWAGPQSLSLRVINRQSTAFDGAIRATVARNSTDIPITAAPGAEQSLSVPIQVNGTGQHDYTISAIDGTAVLRTIKGRFRTSPPLVLTPPCPVHHIVGTGTAETRVDARINVNPTDRQGLRLAVTLSDPSGNHLQGATTPAETGATAGVTVRVPIGAPGVFGITARLLDRSGRELAAGTADVHVRSTANPTITIGPDGFLRVGDKPHFPIGLYSSGRHEEMGRAGFSATHSYSVVTGEAADAINPTDLQLKELLDRSWANGMRMMVELPRKAVEKAAWAQIRRRIETFRNHPGLLCWGSEERVARGEAPLAHVAKLYQLVRELDPAHPLVLGDTRTVIGRLQQDRRNFFPDDCMDAGIWWWYPIPLHTPDGNGLEREPAHAGLLEPPSWLTTTLSRKPLWIAIQSYQKPARDARFPTPAEYRCMAYLSIIKGVKGLWFYTGSGQRDWQGKAAGLLNKPEEANWTYVQTLVRELRHLEPVITAPAATEKLVLSPAGAPLEFALRKHDGALYLLAANKSDRAQQVRFTGAFLQGKGVTVLAEDHRAWVEDDTLRDDFGPLGVRVYQIK